MIKLVLVCFGVFKAGLHLFLILIYWWCYWKCLLTKANKEAIGRKQSLVYFGCLQSGEWGGVNSGPIVNSSNYRKSFYRWRRRLNSESAQSALMVILKLVMQWFDQCHFSGLVLFPFSWGQFSELSQLKSWLQFFLIM